MRDKIRREKIIFCASRQKEQVSFMGYSIRLIDLLTAILKKMKHVSKIFYPEKLTFEQTEQTQTIITFRELLLKKRKQFSDI